MGGGGVWGECGGEGNGAERKRKHTKTRKGKGKGGGGGVTTVATAATTVAAATGIRTRLSFHYHGMDTAVAGKVWGKGHGGQRLSGVRIDPSSEGVIAAAGTDGCVRLWDVGQSRPVTVLGGGDATDSGGGSAGGSGGGSGRGSACGSRGGSAVGSRGGSAGDSGGSLGVVRGIAWTQTEGMPTHNLWLASETGLHACHLQHND